ncbi:MAG: TraB/GumN family protein [Gammaproteobacteria bacterium]|jgi:uncharacterized protein YbaP (TraB family)
MKRSNRTGRSSRLTALIALLLSPAVALGQLPAWRAEHPGHPGTLLLLGSIHLLRADDHPLPSVVDDIYAEADKIVFEIDLDDVEPAQIQTQFMGAAMLSGGASLQDVIAPQLYDRTTSLARELGIDPQLFARFEPWFVATMLMSFGLSNQGYEPRYGIEQYLLAKAVRDRKEVLGVEPLETQVKVFDLLSQRDQSAFLEQTLAELRRDDAAMRQLVEAWRNGDLGDLQADLMSDFAQFPGLYERLVVERNAAWTTVLAALSEHDQVSAVVVGALHLVGDDSVIALLRSRGYAISEIR